MDTIRVGIGYDAHRFAENRTLIIGGVAIPYHLGLAGHSDADVLVHAIIDALLGATAIGDIGVLFPDSDKQYKDINSMLLLQKVAALILAEWDIINIDSVIICEKPKISDYADAMKRNIAAVLHNLGTDRISIKGKTNEKMGHLGREEGIAVHAVALVGKRG